MTPPPRPRATPPPRDPRSTVRLLAGAVLMVLGVALAVAGFLRLIMVLERGGYGTTSVITAVAIFASAGAALATGIALLIWDVAKRYEQK